VVEDAISGVEAGRRGEFALVIGLDRLDQADALAASGADVVVPDLADVTVTGSHLRDASTLPSARSDELWSVLGDLRPAVFLDYDGVLSPIVAHPDLAVLSDEGRTTLDALAAATTVAIVSGRDADDVIGKIGLEGLYYAGSHGLDIRTPMGDAAGGDLARFDAFLPDLDAAEGELREALADVPGSNVERKRFAIAVHYRQVPDEHHGLVAEAVERIAPGHPTLRVAGGKMILELRPDIQWDKGTALNWLIAELSVDVPEVLPVYIGDDITDEDAFRELEHRGLGIVVGRDERPTRAHFALDDTDEVRLFLDELRTRVAGRST
jgi:alpha,alpha-trehalase